MKHTTYTIFLLAFLLAGCAGFLPPQQDAKLANTASCCADISTLPYQELVKGKKIRTLVGPETPAFIFPQGKSYFLALRFSPAENISQLTVRTYPQNMLYNKNGHVFVPRITFLNSRFETISSVSPEFVVQGPMLLIGESSWRVDLQIPAHARAVVIHTSSEERKKTMRMRDSDQRGGYLYTSSGPAGEIEVELQ